MQRKWLRVFLLCVACAVCLHGNCAAERWVQYYPTNSDMDCYLDTDSVHVEEFNGHKYVNATSKMNWKAANAIIIERILFDIDNNTYSEVEVLIRGNGSTGRKNVTGDFVSLNSGDSHDAMLQCIKQNRPDVIQKIQGSNGGGAGSASPSGSTGMQSVTANGDYGFVQTLGNGPVQFVPRMVHKPPTQPAVGDGITRSYVGGVPAVGIRCEHGEFVPQTAPDSGKPLYIIYRASDSIWVHQKNVVEHWIIGIFSYDDETDTFTLYEPVNCTPYKTMHIIDKNQIEIERWSSATGVSQDNPEHFIAKYEKAVISPDWDGAPNRPCDTDGYGWMLTFEDEPEEYQTEVGGWDWLTASIDAQNGGISYANEVGVDGLFVFLARKGQVGYAPPANDNVEYINKAGADFGASTGHLKYN